MVEILLLCAVLLLVLVLVLLAALLRRRPGALPELPRLESRFDGFEKLQERTERALRDELGRDRGEASDHARALRTEVQGALQKMSASLLQNFTGLAEASQSQAHTLQAQAQVSLGSAREEMALALRNFMEFVGGKLGDNSQHQKAQLDGFSRQLAAFAESNEKRQEALRATVEERLQRIQDESRQKLDEMRQIVDEKLQGTLDKRLGESFQIVSDRLEQVHRGLGEMQALAVGVGDLKRVLTNVKTRGTWGEVQLKNLLDQVLTKEQYGENVVTRPGSRDHVEFAVRLPGRDRDGQIVWLPIDAKFPQEDYLRLVEASERADVEAVEAAGQKLEARVRSCARDIREKYIAPPHTTDFAILFLPTEGLYAEVLRRTGIVEALQREDRVVVAGPTTLAALLNSLQMGFRTLAIEQRSSEVWKTLGVIKTEFTKFGDLLDKVRKKMTEATNTLDDVASKSRNIEKKLKGVEALPALEVGPLLAGAETPVAQVGADA